MRLIDCQSGDAFEKKAPVGVAAAQRRPLSSRFCAEGLLGRRARGLKRNAAHKYDEMKGSDMHIYVGNIPLNATERDLRGLFAAYGLIEAAEVSIDRETDQPLGFGLVELVDHARAHEAVHHLDGSVWNGRTLVVSGGRAAVGSQR